MKSLITGFLLSLSLFTFAQEKESDYLFTMDTQVHQNQDMIWNHQLEHPLIEGDPAVFRFSAENFKMLVRVTCHSMEKAQVLLTVQSETLMKNNENKVNFFSNLKTIVIQLGEPVYYYPLGIDRNSSEGEAVMRLLISIVPLEDQMPGEQE